MAKKSKIIQIGGQTLTFSEAIKEKFHVIYLPGNYDLMADEAGERFFVEGEFNPKHNRSLFILGADALLLRSFPLQLAQFPAYQIFYDAEAEISPHQEQILEQKFAHPYRTKEDSLESLREKVWDLSIGQMGYKVKPEMVAVSEGFKGQSTKFGNSYMQLIGEFTPEFSEILHWRRHSVDFGAGDKLAFYPEDTVVKGDLELEYRIYVLEKNHYNIIKVIKGSPQQFRNQEIIVHNDTEHTVYTSIGLYAKGGQGEIQVGNIHFRKYLNDKSVMFSGATTLIDRQVRNEEVNCYFHPGDMKPPLSVYFSGYRSAEGMEGRGMMANMGGPFILLGDPRLEGGNFYLGSSEFEAQISQFIQDKLEWLGFSNQDLILSGLSMGTFGALYYAADLSPAAVIVGKPLANIGTIALNERINRPEMWGTSLDMVLHHGGSSTTANAESLDQKFWDKFSKGNYDSTTFALAYMKQDDYDHKAFSMLVEKLKSMNSKATLLYKGFIGRHNDNSPGINSWFIKQYRNVLLNKYGRDIDFRL
ncbi:accessory Sec system protein Asp2 [Lactococcus garvieae]|nr:accessory Sec system protein Asp2 [Lactococcus garvieae]